MKHPLTPTVLIILFFLLAQISGLALLAADITTQTDEVTGETTVEYSETIGGPRPDTTGGTSFIFLAVGVTIGTIILLILAKLQLQKIWKVWYFLAVWVAMAIAIGAVLPAIIAYIATFILTAWKIFKPNLFVHNISEVLVYTGIAFLLVPIFDVFWASMLLIAIAIYDAIAVWKSKHMISLANFQTESKLFAGLQIPYNHAPPPITKPQKTTSEKTTKKKKTKTHSAILGGGDIAFPLLYTGAILQMLVTTGYTSLEAFLLSLIITAAAAASLVVLFTLAKKDRFYPAMPILSTGCFVGYAILLLVI